jgi:tetratricopeptide (TPR) repeat protein
MNSINPSFDPDAIFSQAVSLESSGKLKEAAELYKKLNSHYPNNSRVLTNLGTIELKMGNLEEGVKLLGKSLKVDPNQPNALSNRGIALHDLNRFEEAIASYNRAIALKSNFADAYNNRGNSLHNLHRLDEALASIDRAIELQPDRAEAHNNRGNVLRDLNRLDEALASIDRAIALKPGYAEAYCNRGNVLQDLNRLDEALASFDSAISLKPDYAEAYWNKSLLKILIGDYEEGWKLYEWRWKRIENRTFKRLPQPLWLGEQSIANKSILIRQEQGLGDVIQFCRYTPMVEALGAQVIMEVSTPLVSLISTLKGNFTIIEKGKPLPDFDLQCPIMSLPLAFRTAVSAIPSEIPYLYADGNKQEIWRKRLGGKTIPRVGLAWSGSIIHKKDFNRSIPLKFFEPLFKLPIEFHSLQKEVRKDDAVVLSNYKQIKLHQNRINDFSDTAALVQEMDLVISVDTAVAHLSGALGKNVWILLPYIPDFRWMLHRSDSPWYPTATLFRQPKIGDWTSAISEVAEKLQLLS